MIAIYQGFSREFCPHVLGWNSQGDEQALCYQFGGGSRSGLSTNPDQNWRCVRLNELTIVEIRDGEWHSRGNYEQQPSTCVAKIEIEIDRAVSGRASPSS